MKRYFVITHQSEHNGHLNVQDLLPASCKLITGVTVIATVKQTGALNDITEELVFPQALITNLLKQERITGLFYSYLRTRSTEAESRVYFEASILPEIISVLSENIRFTCLDEARQQLLTDNLRQLLSDGLADYLYHEAGLYDLGKTMTNTDFADFIALHVLMFAYKKKEEVFFFAKQAYKRPEPYECGNISLLINGNSFLLRDYVLTANRKVRNLQKEIIPFHEPLEVNSNIHTVFKSNKNSDGSLLTIRIYIEYEHK
ncbi:MAG: hypothetical protein PF495_09080 [Spirochaetales bacterium]|jgi:hypothetical protein|nr:hypothetical protein [Spirochaetales bacterium]